MTAEQREALQVARELAYAGVPVFLAVPHTREGCQYAHCNEGIDSKAEFHHPAGWQHVEAGPPSIERINAWQPGDALCAVMGHTVDTIDVDPRNGGDDSYAALCAAGLMPTAYGIAATPSGGSHYLVAGLHAAKGKAGAGIDVQAGADDGSGRGFIYIAPTARVPKPVVEGAVPVAYHWTQRPDLSDMEGDESGHALGEILREAKAPPAAIVPGAADPDDPFDGPDDSMTVDDAKAAYLPVFNRFREMRTPQDTGFNDALNKTAVILGHYVPAFMSVEQATSALYSAAVHNLSVDYQGSAAVHKTIASGLSAGMRTPRTRREAPDPDTEGSPEEPSAADLLIGEMLTPDQLANLPRLKPLIQGVLDLNTIAWIIGKSGSYKSFVLLDMLACVATGKPWHGREVTQGLVIYIVGEGVAGTSLRMAAWQRLHGAIGSQFLILPRPVQAKTPAAWDVLVEACAKLGPVAVAVDTQARATIGLEENNNSEMMIYVNAVDRIKQATGATVITVHHIGRAGTDARGASSIDGAQDAELRVERVADRQITIHMDKQKDADDSDVIELELARVNEDVVDPETGRSLSSLAVVDPGTIDKPAPIRDWEDNLSTNQIEIAGVIFDHFKVGGTEGNIERTMNERRALGGVPKMAHGSFTSAWGALIKKGVTIKIRGSQRYLLSSMAED